MTSEAAQGRRPDLRVGMDWNLVQLFVEVVDAGSMSEAARRRGLTRAAVSQRLKLLEQQTKAQLLRRTTRALKPTDIGLTLYEHGKRIELQFEAARYDVASLGQTLSGYIRVSLPPGIGQTHLAPALAEFSHQNPEVRLGLVFNNRIPDLLEAGIDIAVKIGSTPPEDAVAREVGDVRWRFFCTPEYLAKFGPCENPSDLSRAAFLSTQDGRKVEVELTNGGQTSTITLAPRLASENVLFLRSCLVAHMGVALLPQYVASDLVGEGRLVELLPHITSSKLGGKLFILTHANRFPTPAAQAVIEVLRASARQVLAGGEFEPS